MRTTIDKAGWLVIPTALPSRLGLDRALVGPLSAYATLSDARHSPAAQAAAEADDRTAGSNRPAVLVRVPQVGSPMVSSMSAAAQEPDVGRPRREYPLGEFLVSSRLSELPEIVWDHAMSPAGVNRELRPLLRMTFPPGISEISASWKPGERLFRSWLALGGFLPVEYDDVTFAEVEPGRRFLERSSMLSQRVWEHERVIEPDSHGCRITDRIRFVPRLPWLARFYAPLFRAVFWLRHRNLRRLFGAVA